MKALCCLRPACVAGAYINALLKCRPLGLGFHSHLLVLVARATSANREAPD